MAKHRRYRNYELLYAIINTLAAVIVVGYVIGVVFIALGK